MASGEKSGLDEWRANWPLVLACMLAVTWVTAPSSSLGLFMEPLQKEFGWGRGQISYGPFLYAMVSIVLVPFYGAIVDKYGTRTIGLPGLALNGLAFAAFGLLTGSITHWLGAWLVYTLTQLLIGTFVWNGAISAAFTKSRGLAIGVVMGGTAIGQIVTPLASRWLIDAYGWRMAYVFLGIGWAGLALVVCLLFFHDPRARRKGESAADQQDRQGRAQGGLTLREALRTPRFLRLALAILLQSTLATGLILHLVPLLSNSGISRAEAASIAAATGATALAGQLVTGWLADRTNTTLLPVSCFLMTGIGYLLLQRAEGSELLAWLGALTAGYALGATINITTYLTSRYVGVLHFGKIYGVISSAMRLGAGLGPVIAGTIFDRSGSYHAYLLFGIGAACVAALSVFGLGTYPSFAPVQAEDSTGIAPEPAST
ncbi:MAG: MFS transporter [Novosphingobium sp.]